MPRETEGAIDTGTAIRREAICDHHYRLHLFSSHPGRTNNLSNNEHFHAFDFKQTCLPVGYADELETTRQSGRSPRVNDARRENRTTVWLDSRPSSGVAVRSV